MTTSQVVLQPIMKLVERAKADLTMQIGDLDYYHREGWRSDSRGLRSWTWRSGGNPPTLQEYSTNAGVASWSELTTIWNGSLAWKAGTCAC